MQISSIMKGCAILQTGTRIDLLVPNHKVRIAKMHMFRKREKRRGKTETSNLGTNIQTMLTNHLVIREVGKAEMLNTEQIMIGAAQRK